MIFLLNYLPIILFLIGALISYRYVAKGRVKAGTITIVLTTLIVILYSGFAPSYMPKGNVYKPAVAEFEVSEAEVENRLRVARTEEEHDKRLDEGLDWKEKAERSKEEAESKD